ncbi:serine proteinase stubble-like [Schistocerca americana]|uniref:serine proteinase stubble-like n=1 Tax=Schistocerca americana TaxID=7009 RepID=UPI001F50118D|nr:serine proteinase stubble-like [Schistocerca americana]
MRGRRTGAGARRRLAQPPPEALSSPRRTPQCNRPAVSGVTSQKAAAHGSSSSSSSSRWCANRLLRRVKATAPTTTTTTTTTTTKRTVPSSNALDVNKGRRKFGRHASATPLSSGSPLYTSLPSPRSSAAPSLLGHWLSSQTAAP